MSGFSLPPSPLREAKRKANELAHLLSRYGPVDQDKAANLAEELKQLLKEVKQ